MTIDFTVWTFDQVQQALSIVSNALINLNGAELNSNFMRQLVTNISTINIAHPIQFTVNPYLALYDNKTIILEKWTLNFPFNVLFNGSGIYKILIYRFVDTLIFKGYKSFIPPKISEWQLGDNVLSVHYNSDSLERFWIIKHFPILNNSTTFIKKGWTFNNLLEF